jgi:hypothetical protein
MWRIRSTFTHGLGVPQITVGQRRRNGRENEKDEKGLRDGDTKESWLFPLVTN